MSNLLPKGWRLISDLKGNAFMNMAIDEAIAIAHPESNSTIRFYTWKKPAVSIGYFQRIMPVVNWLNNSPSLNTPLYPLPDKTLQGQVLIEGKGTIDIVRRPTGGGIVLHGTDLTYSVATGLPRGFAPRNDNSSRNLIPLFYMQMGQVVIEGLRLLGITANLKSAVGAGFKPAPAQDSGPSLCAQTPVDADVLIEGMKVAGCAARRFGETVLIQGYISIGHITGVTTRQLIDAMIKGFMTSLNIELVHGKLTDGEVTFAEELNSKKYSRDEWNYKR